MRYLTVAVSPEGRIYLTIRTLTPFLEADERDYSVTELPVVMAIISRELGKEIDALKLPRIEGEMLSDFDVPVGAVSVYRLQDGEC